jgi:UDP-glucose 6-dehydrogenase
MLLSQHYKVYVVDIVSEKVELINKRKFSIQDEADRQRVQMIYTA